jgi:PmbA protein
MTEAQAVELASKAVAIARNAGADEAEATLSHGRSFHVEAREKELTKLEQSTGRTMHMRLIVGGRRVSVGTSDVSNDSLQSVIGAAIEQAKEVTPDPLAGLPENCGALGIDLKLFDPALASRDDALKVDDALSLERIIRASDARVTNSGGSHYGDGISTVAIANSCGFARAYTATRVSRSTSPVAEDGGHKRTSHYGTASRYVNELESNDSVAKMAAKRCVEMFGASKPHTGRMPVIFERDVAAAVLDDLFSAINAANVAIGNSWLADRLGERIGSDLINIADDGTMPRLLGSSPFDGEGVMTQRTSVFEAGVLKSFLFDTYYARKLGQASTGNSTGGGIGANNFYLESGRQSLEQLIAATPRGVLVLDTIGFATEHASGTYSRGARGFMIEGGELAYPIDEFTIAAHFAEMLASVDAVASDLRFDGSVVSPSFRVAEMTISGN